MLLLTKVVLVVLLVGMTGYSQTTAAPVVDRLEEDGAGGNVRLKRDANAMLNFLFKYGYLRNDSQNGPLHSEETITIAIKEFQKLNGLKVSGVPDLATMTKMKAPRCGLPDIIHSDIPNNNNNNNNNPFAYTTIGTRWSKNSLTWMPTQLSAKLRESDQLSAIEKAFAVWAEVTPLSFKHTQYEPDIEIKFVRGEHEDGPHNKFDGRSGVLAHAFGPGANLGGDTHFDEDEAWSIGTGQGIDLIQVAAHEFGHALGLAHSSVAGALMAPYYMYSDELTLKDDDIRGIQAIYGPKVKRPLPSVVPTSRPTLPVSTARPTRPAITSRPTRPAITSRPTRSAITRSVTAATSVRPTSNRSTQRWTPDYCKDNFQLDAISQGPNEQLYAFRGNNVYKFNGQEMELGYPKLISQVLPNGPVMSINAATFVPETGKTYIFKDFQVWRYTNFILDNGYPKIWTDNKNMIPSAAITVTYRGRSQIFMFGSDYFWEWNHYTERISQGYPLATQTYFPHAPNSPDAALVNQQGHFFFFKGNSYKKLEDRGRDSDLKALGKNLFGSVCGGQPELLGFIKQYSLNGQKNKILANNQIPEPEFSPMIWTLIKRHRSTILELLMLKDMDS